MLISDIVELLEAVAPPALQESYDNSGLLTGSADSECTGVLLCLDCTEEVLEEARQKSCNLVIAHHPVIFSGLKRLNGKNYVERTIISAIRNNIAIYAMHTNLDNTLKNGVNEKIAQKLGLRDLSILQPMGSSLKKLVTFCPDAYADVVRQALFNAGCGQIGKYDSCSFNAQGQGSFRAGEGADPFVGEKGELHYEAETRIETIFEAFSENRILSALKKAHPYEEVAYYIQKLDNSNQDRGAGVIGELEETMDTDTFLSHLKKSMALSCIRYAGVDRQIRRVAVCGGSGSFLLGQAKKRVADVLVTADFKYHQFFDAEKDILIADIGHYESEIYTLEIFHSLITEKYGTFAVLFTSTNTNPIKYFI